MMRRNTFEKENKSRVRNRTKRGKRWLAGFLSGLMLAAVWPSDLPFAGEPPSDEADASAGTQVSSDEIDAPAEPLSAPGGDNASAESQISPGEMNAAAGTLPSSDESPPVVTLLPPEGGSNGIFRTDTEVGVQVEDEQSGIARIHYRITAEGKVTAEQDLYVFEDGRGTEQDGTDQTDTGEGDPGQKSYSAEARAEMNPDEEAKDPLPTFTGTIPVRAAENNSCHVRVEVTAVDTAGNEATQELSLDMDATVPEISVTYDETAPQAVIDGRGYYRQPRTATVSIRERTHHFDGKAATERLKEAIWATDATGKRLAIDLEPMVGEWTTAEGDTPDEAIHTATIFFTEDGNYTFRPEYTDMAGNEGRMAKNGDTDSESGISDEQFTIDTTAPEGWITAEAEGRWEKTWSEKAEKLTFSLWSDRRINVTGGAKDRISPLAGISYYRDDGERLLTAAELKQIDAWEEADQVEILPDARGVVYLRMEDCAGNVGFVSTDGLIADGEKPQWELAAPDVSADAARPVNGIYHADVKVDIRVADPVKRGVWSGIESVSYEVLSMGQVTQTGILYGTEDGGPAEQEARDQGTVEQEAKDRGSEVWEPKDREATDQESKNRPLRVWSGSLVVDSGKNNSNDVEVVVYARDHAGNSTVRSLPLKIDVTRPEVTVRYDNNDADNGTYFDEGRTAVIEITERNFAEDGVTVSVTSTGGDVPGISGWRTVSGDGNGDADRHIAAVSFAEDGDYTFSVACADAAGNLCSGTNFAPGTQAPETFTVDKSAPVVFVSYDNNDVQNGRYFREERTATVTVCERNFDVGRVSFSITAAIEGEPLPQPEPVWSHSGDFHTARISFARDGDYAFAVSASDRAGNRSGKTDYGVSAVPNRFTVDTAVDELTIGGVEDKTAYPGELSIDLFAEDINFDSYEAQLVCSHLRQTDKAVVRETNRDLTEAFPTRIQETEQGISLQGFSIEQRRENDGIYTLTVSVSDMAGNKKEESVTFTVNRFGSVYTADRYLTDELQGAYVQRVERDLTITEYNASPVPADSVQVQITRDGEPLRDVKAALTEAGASGESGWYENRYVISADNFCAGSGRPADGVYRITVSSRDEAGNEPELSVGGGYDFLFRVDATRPEFIRISGLEQPFVNGSQQEVSFAAMDTIGLARVDVYLDGELLLSRETGEDRTKISGQFTIPEGTRRRIRLTATDLAGNTMDTGSAEFQPGYAFCPVITVSANVWPRLAGRNRPAKAVPIPAEAVPGLTAIPIRPVIPGLAAVLTIAGAIVLWRKARRNGEKKTDRGGR